MLCLSRFDTHLTGDTAAAQELGHQAILDVAEAGSLLEVVLWQEHVPETKLLRLDLELLHDLRVGVPSLLLGGSKLIPVDCLGRNTFLLDKLLELFWGSVSDRLELHERRKVQYQEPSLPCR